MPDGDVRASYQAYVSACSCGPGSRNLLTDWRQNHILANPHTLCAV